jgi:hypothetical protein
VDTDKALLTHRGGNPFVACAMISAVEKGVNVAYQPLEISGGVVESVRGSNPAGPTNFR